MMRSLRKSHSTIYSKIISSFISFTFIFSLVIPPGFAQVLPGAGVNLPMPGTIIPLTSEFTPALIKGLTIHPDNPLMFDFIVDTGDTNITGEALKSESDRMIKYFLATLTVPEEELWVNLSPYEKTRIIPDGLGKTELGRDLLAQDYLLKQLTASMIYPEDELGKAFWQRVYKRAEDLFGTTEIPVNTFNKIWIVPDRALVVEHGNSAFVVESHLRVMLEEDYVALLSNMGNEQFRMNEVDDNQAHNINAISSQIVKEILIPEIEKEVNQGKTFAQLRQIYNAMILATWYKETLKDSLLGQVYVDRNKTKGVDVEDKEVKNKIYSQYVEAFKKGVYNYIKEDIDPATREPIPRKYFSGGFDGNELARTTDRVRLETPADLTRLAPQDQRVVERGTTPKGTIYQERVSMVENATPEDIARATPPRTRTGDLAMLGTGREIQAGAIVGQKLHQVLASNSPSAANFLKGGANQPGYGVAAMAVNDGSHAIGNEGNQGYYVDRTDIQNADGSYKSGKEVFVDTVQSMKDFFKRRAERNGKPIRLVIKTGIGGQHTPFQGLADAFEVIDVQTGQKIRIRGDYELGENYEASLERVVSELGIGWDQIAVIPSSKSGSTDETMMVYVEILKVVLNKIAQDNGVNGDRFAQTTIQYLHDINFENGQEIAGKDLFKKFDFTDLVAKVSAADPAATADTTKKILGTVLGNMFFETTDRPEASRLSAFVRNSGLDQVLGEDAPGFGAMFDNVGGRWTGDLHMMSFLAFHDLDAGNYWQTRYEGIKKVRAGDHAANELGNMILNRNIKNIAFVVPDAFFWAGKDKEQNFNESIWQNGFANLRAIKASAWEQQAHNYAGDEESLVVNFSNLDIGGKDFTVYKVAPVDLNTTDRQQVANEIGRVFTTFYGMTYTVGTRLIARALEKEGYTADDIDVNDLGNPATKIFQQNLFLRQPFVELGKGLLETRLKSLQEAQAAWQSAGAQGTSPIEQAVDTMVRSAQNREAVTNIDDLKPAVTDVSDMGKLAQSIFEANRYASDHQRTFVPFIYLEGEKFQELREHLVDLGIEWVLQGTGDQHISWQQVLAQPQRYLPFVISFVPEKANLVPGTPAIGFAKGYLDNISPNMVRDYFAEASYNALTQIRQEQGGRGVFVRIADTPQVRAQVRDAFTDAVENRTNHEMKVLAEGRWDKWVQKPVTTDDLNTDMFRDYDYRNTGPYLKPEMAFRLGLIWADMAIKKAEEAGIAKRTVLVARDARKVENDLVDALVSALRYRGLDVIYMSQDTPNAVTSYSWGVQQFKPLMSIFMTASHVAQPKDVIVRGFKVAMLKEKGGNIQSMSTQEIKQESLQAIRELLSDSQAVQAKAAPQKGSFTPVNIDENVIRFNALVGRAAAAKGSLYELGQALKKSDQPLAVLEEFENRFAGQETPLRGMKIVIEGSHTPSGNLAANTFRALGAEVIALNNDIREISGMHNADPSVTANLKDLEDAIKANNADFGMAFDLDGDRGAIHVPVRSDTSPEITFQTLAPDNMIVALLPALIADWGYGQSGKTVGVIRDVLGTHGVNDISKKLGAQFFQTDAGYVFLKAMKEKMEKQGYVFPIYGERSGHTWLDVSGEIENPVAVGVLFATLVKRSRSDLFEQRAAGQLITKTEINPVLDVYEELAIPYLQSPRFQPLFHPALLERLSADPRNDTGWTFSRENPTRPPTKIIALGKDTAIAALKQEFTPGKEYETAVGTLSIKEFNTYQDPADEGGLSRFADIVFEKDGLFAGRFVFRASSNDPSFVTSYEAPQWEGEKLSSTAAKRRAIAQTVGNFLAQQNIAVLTRDGIRDAMPQLAADQVQTLYEKANLEFIETDMTDQNPGQDDEIIISDRAMLNDLSNMEDLFDEGDLNPQSRDLFRTFVNMAQNPSQDNAPLKIPQETEGIAGNFKPSALLTPEERATKLGAISYNEVKSAMEASDDQHVFDLILTGLDAGKGTSLKRQKYVQQFWQTTEIGAKGTDLGFEGILPEGEIVSVAEIKLLRILAEIHQGKIPTRGKVYFQPIVSPDSQPSYTALMQQRTIARTPDGKFVRGEKTYSDLLRENNIIVQLGRRVAKDYPSIDISRGELTYERGASASHGEWGFKLLRESLDHKASDIPEIVAFYNGDGTNNMPDENIIRWMIAENVPIVMISTTKTGIDKKGGQIGIEFLPDGKTRVRMLEEASAINNGQGSLFEVMGLEDGIGEPGQQYFNTNIAVLNYSLLTRILQDLRDEVFADHVEDLYRILAPDLIVSKKKGEGGNRGVVGKEYQQLEGPIGTVFLNLNNFFETSENPKVKEILERHIGKNKKLLRIVNVGTKDRTHFFTPTKLAIDHWLQAYSDYYRLNPDTWMLEDAVPGSTPPKFALSNAYYKDISNLMDAFEGVSVINLRDLDVDRAVVKLKNAVLKGKVMITNRSGQEIDLNNYKGALGQEGQERLTLENILVIIEKDGTLRKFKYSGNDRAMLASDISLDEAAESLEYNMAESPELAALINGSAEASEIALELIQEINVSFASTHTIAGTDILAANLGGSFLNTSSPLPGYYQLDIPVFIEVIKGRLEGRIARPQLAAQTAPEAAARVTTPVSAAATQAPGGIDLNSAFLNLQIKRDGNGVPLPLPQQPIGNMNIEGFAPVIINITPMPNMPLILGLGDEEPADDGPSQVSYNLSMAINEE